LPIFRNDPSSATRTISLAMPTSFPSLDVKVRS
jgi:hypothetical protein